MRRMRFRKDGAHVADVGAAVDRRVRVERLAPAPRRRQADPIAVSDLGREVADDRDGPVGLGAHSQEGVHRLVFIVDDDPPEALGLAIARVQRRTRAIEGVEVAHERLQTLVRPIVEQPPRQRIVGVPFAGLAELLPHEQQLLAGMAPHEAVIGARIGETLPFIARHLADDRTFAVDDFVVRDRQDEVFGEGVEQPEGHLVVAPTPIDRIARHVLQRVVHPTHVPFEAEAEAAEIRRPGDAGKCRRFLGDRHGAGKFAVDRLVGPLEEGDRVAGSRCRLPRWGAIRRVYANNRGRASRRPHRRAGRRRDSDRPSRARCVSRKLATSARPKS